MLIWARPGEQPRARNQAGVDRLAQATVGAGDLAGGGVPRQQTQLGIAEQPRGRHRRRHRLGVADRQDPHVGVQVDQAGQDREPGHLQRLGAPRPLPADRDDAPTLDHHPRDSGRVTAAAVDQRATLQDQCHRVLLASRLGCQRHSQPTHHPRQARGDALQEALRLRHALVRWGVPEWCGRLRMGTDAVLTGDHDVISFGSIARRRTAPVQTRHHRRSIAERLLSSRRQPPGLGRR
jgi:hypothetical protein